MKDLLKVLDNMSVLDLVGMGSIGKMTLTMEINICFSLHQQLEKYFFLKDERLSEPPLLKQNPLSDLGHYFEFQSICPQEYN